MNFVRSRIAKVILAVSILLSSSAHAGQFGQIFILLLGFSQLNSGINPVDAELIFDTKRSLESYGPANFSAQNEYEYEHPQNQTSFPENFTVSPVFNKHARFVDLDRMNPKLRHQIRQKLHQADQVFHGLAIPPYDSQPGVLVSFALIGKDGLALVSSAGLPTDLDLSKNKKVVKKILRNSRAIFGCVEVEDNIYCRTIARPVAIDVSEVVKDKLYLHLKSLNQNKIPEGIAPRTVIWHGPLPALVKNKLVNETVEYEGLKLRCHALMGTPNRSGPLLLACPFRCSPGLQGSPVIWENPNGKPILLGIYGNNCEVTEEGYPPISLSDGAVFEKKDYDQVIQDHLGHHGRVPVYLIDQDDVIPRGNLDSYDKGHLNFSEPAKIEEIDDGE